MEPASVRTVLYSGWLVSVAEAAESRADLDSFPVFSPRAFFSRLGGSITRKPVVRAASPWTGMDHAGPTDSPGTEPCSYRNGQPVAAWNARRSSGKHPMASVGGWIGLRRLLRVEFQMLPL